MTDTAGHPDVTEISDLTEGLLPPSRSMDIRRHLDDCSLCADVYESLEEIRDLLGTLPGPLRMPDDVADRVDAALSAEADGLSLDRHQRGSGHVSRETSTAADRPTGRSRGATGPGRPNRPRRGRRRTVTLGAVFTAAALGLGGLIVQSMGSGSSDKDPASPPARQSGPANTFAGEKLEVQVAGLLAQAEKKKESSPRSSRPRGTESMESPGIFNLPTDSVPACVRRGIGQETPPIAFKEGSYNGKDAYLVVLPALTDTDRVTAYVVDSACVDKPSVSAGKVLLKHSYPRN
ncbi:anti-sigma factor family protein [Streptomyces beigongshangae]|uniref:anti-sigma factor family protein n=1 Tax=Streptomyces beigongshangae TaxID=2841597 RepID=UPI0021A5C756|nr:hypothetical protein [Streptomyces sp. REN17]